MSKKKAGQILILAVVFKPGEEPRPYIVWNELKAFQEIVDGHIETVRINDEIVLVCDEEGRLKGKTIQHIEGIGEFAGTVFICGVDGDEFTDVPKDFARAYVR